MCLAQDRAYIIIFGNVSYYHCIFFCIIIYLLPKCVFVIFLFFFSKIRPLVRFFFKLWMFAPIKISHDIATDKLLKLKTLKKTSILQYTSYFECYYLLLLNIIVHLLKVWANFGFSNLLSKFGGANWNVQLNMVKIGCSILHDFYHNKKTL